MSVAQTGLELNPETHYVAEDDLHPNHGVVSLLVHKILHNSSWLGISSILPLSLEWYK